MTWTDERDTLDDALDRALDEAIDAIHAGDELTLRPIRHLVLVHSQDAIPPAVLDDGSPCQWCGSSYDGHAPRWHARPTDPPGFAVHLAQLTAWAWGDCQDNLARERKEVSHA